MKGVEVDTNFKDFWNTIKPFLSGKSHTKTAEIILKDNDNIIPNQSDVCNILNILNDVYVNIAKKWH